MKQLMILVAAALSLAACETIEGFGRDVQAGGEAIAETSNEVQAEM